MNQGRQETGTTGTTLPGRSSRGAPYFNFFYISVFRYVHKDTETCQWTIKERFIEYFPLNDKTGFEFADEILNG